MADKLSKIARDKIIPIREEEEEQLRINNTAPIVQVTCLYNATSTICPEIILKSS